MKTIELWLMWLVLIALWIEFGDGFWLGMSGGIGLGIGLDSVLSGMRIGTTHESD